MSFMLTPDAILGRRKTVTRRTGWQSLEAGTLVRAVRKGMGLKRGEKIEPLAIIRVVDVRREPLSRMIDDLDYGFAECEREGFGDHPNLRVPSEFVDFFCRTHRACERDSTVTRIEFEYVERET